jgi:hypothetical protein
MWTGTGSFYWEMVTGFIPYPQDKHEVSLQKVKATVVRVPQGSEGKGKTKCCCEGLVETPAQPLPTPVPCNTQVTLWPARTPYQ